MRKTSDVAGMVFSKILIKSLNLAENPYKIPKFGGKSNYIQKIGGDNVPSVPRFSHVWLTLHTNASRHILFGPTGHLA